MLPGGLETGSADSYHFSGGRASGSDFRFEA